MIDVSQFIFLYFYFYNMTLALIFLIFFNNFFFYLKTFYSLQQLRFNILYAISLIVAFFSLAGVPPFTGFFLKLLLVVKLYVVDFHVWYMMLFVLFILSLYFYVQNVRFLFNPLFAKQNYSFVKTKLAHTAYFNMLWLLLVILVLGYSIFDVYFYWFEVLSFFTL